MKSNETKSLHALLQEVPPLPESIEKAVMTQRARQKNHTFVRPAMAALFILGLTALFVLPLKQPSPSSHESMESYFAYLTEESDELSYEPLTEIIIY